MPASCRGSGIAPARLHTPPLGGVAGLAPSAAAPARQRPNAAASINTVLNLNAMGLLLSSLRLRTRTTGRSRLRADTSQLNAAMSTCFQDGERPAPRLDTIVLCDDIVRKLSAL